LVPRGVRLGWFVFLHRCNQCQQVAHHQALARFPAIEMVAVVRHQMREFGIAVIKIENDGR